jgi:hypothetical protein
LDGFVKIGEMLLRVENIKEKEAKERVGGSSNQEKSVAVDGGINSTDSASNSTLKPSKSSEKKSKLKSITIDKNKSFTPLSSSTGPSPSPPPPSSSASSPSIIRHYHPLTGATTATEGAAATRQHTHSRTQSAAFDLANDLLKGKYYTLS